MINATVNLNLDTKTLKSQGDAAIKSFLIKEENTKMIHLCVILSYLGGFSPFFSIIMIYPAIKYTHNIL